MKKASTDEASLIVVASSCVFLIDRQTDLCIDDIGPGASLVDLRVPLRLGFSATMTFLSSSKLVELVQKCACWKETKLTGTLNQRFLVLLYLLVKHKRRACVREENFWRFSLTFCMCCFLAATGKDENQQDHWGNKKTVSLRPREGCRSTYALHFNYIYHSSEHWNNMSSKRTLFLPEEVFSFSIFLALSSPHLLPCQCAFSADLRHTLFYFGKRPESLACNPWNVKHFQLFVRGWWWSRNNLQWHNQYCVISAKNHWKIQVV